LFAAIFIPAINHTLSSQPLFCLIVSLVGGEAIPFQCLGVAPGYALSLAVTIAQLILRPGVVLFRGKAIQHNIHGYGDAFGGIRQIRRE